MPPAPSDRTRRRSRCSWETISISRLEGIGSTPTCWRAFSKITRSSNRNSRSGRCIGEQAIQRQQLRFPTQSFEVGGRRKRAALAAGEIQERERLLCKSVSGHGQATCL